MSTSFFGCLPCYAITTLSCYLYVFSLWRDKYDDNVHYRSSRISSGRVYTVHLPACCCCKRRVDRARRPKLTPVGPSTRLIDHVSPVSAEMRRLLLLLLLRRCCYLAASQVSSAGDRGGARSSVIAA